MRWLGDLGPTNRRQVAGDQKSAALTLVAWTGGAITTRTNTKTMRRSVRALIRLGSMPQTHDAPHRLTDHLPQQGGVEAGQLT